MQESIEDYRYSIELALDNAKKRLDILEPIKILFLMNIKNG